MWTDDWRIRWCCWYRQQQPVDHLDDGIAGQQIRLRNVCRRRARQLAAEGDLQVDAEVVVVHMSFARQLPYQDHLCQYRAHGSGIACLTEAGRLADDDVTCHCSCVGG
jgi:hypothetical protein